MEDNQIGKNISSGAQKVEKTQRTRPTQKTAAKNTSGSKTHAAKTVTKEAQEAEKRFESAKAIAAERERKLMKKAEQKQQKLKQRAHLKEEKSRRRADAARKKEQRRQMREERRAELARRRMERRAEHLARRELLKNESKADRRARLAREKKERLALRAKKADRRAKEAEKKREEREARRMRRSENKRHRRERKTERKQHAPGFGGWLAAVISLGTACLILATVVTAGALRMNNLTEASRSGYRSTLYEMSAAAEDMDNNLAKLSVSSGASEQSSLLAEVLVDASSMESSLEKLPVEALTGTDISSFINRTGSYCRSLLRKLAGGQTLNETEKNTLAYLQKINSELSGELNTLVTHPDEKQLELFLAGKSGTISEQFTKIGQGTLQEPEETVDPPFADAGNVGENQLEAQEEVSLSQAEEAVRQALGDYRIRSVVCTGETTKQGAECYNLHLEDEDGAEIFAQVTKRGGNLALFNTYERCGQKNFDLDMCDEIAQEFLSSLGMENMQAVWLSDADAIADITYVSVQDGVRVYPDCVRVRVCESKGRVVGMEAMEYLLNHRERTIGETLSREEAQSRLSSTLEVYSAHLAVIPLNGEETLVHEFAAKNGEEEYILYLDALSGEELQVYRVKNSTRGRYLD